MAAASRAVSVTTTATRLDNATSGSSSQGAAIYNNGAATVYVGGADVTTSNGYPLAAGAQLTADLTEGDALYGRVATGTVEVRVLDIRI